MGSTNQDPFAPFKGCTLEICTIYCPQYCYIFPPPPPPPPFDDSDGPNFSPLIIAIIGILTVAFLLIGYYTIVSKYCKTRPNSHPNLDSDQHHILQDLSQHTPTGLDEAIIKSIPTRNYKNSDGLIGESDCSVCLSEFVDEESLRLLPKCNHAFHVECIDKWLLSHSNCPLCRANITPPIEALPPTPPPPPPPQVNVSALTVNRVRDMILVINDAETGIREECVTNSSRPIRIADILQIDDDSFSFGSNDRFANGIGSQK